MKQRISFLLACVFLCLPGCRASGAEQTFFAMDTVMSVQVSGRRGPQAVAAARGAVGRLGGLLSRPASGSQDAPRNTGPGGGAHSLGPVPRVLPPQPPAAPRPGAGPPAREAVERLDGLLSRTDSDSQIARLNTAAGDGAAVAVDPDVAELLAFSQEIARQLPGDFDITIAPVMDAWGFTTEERHVPAPDALAAAMALVDSAELSVDTEASAASLARAGMEVDLGAVAKGFAAREAEAAIRDAGGTSAMLDLGGNVTVIGAKEDGSPWRVAVKDPRDTGSYLCVLALTDVTLSTSGGYERYFEEDGVRYHHIIDPETGYPADSGLLSVTVVSADHLLADALSTALFVAGPEEALDFWRSRDDFELVLCTGQGELLVTEGLEDVFTFAGADRGYTYEIARR